MAGYNPHRSENWNYGGKNWRLSRSKIDLFFECPRCFYLDNKLGTGRPRGPSFTLNIAVDALFKKEFDAHRAKETPHPLMEEYGIDAIPYQHADIDIWRENFKGLEHTHKETGLTVSGAIDDVWVNPQGELLVVDYKATAKNGKIESLADSAWEEQYRRQIGVYQWLLKQNGFSVSPTGYFVYANGSADEEAFDGKLLFDVTVIPVEGKTDWVDGVLTQIKDVLEDGRVPKSSGTCEYCQYRQAAGEALLSNQKGTKDKKTDTKDHEQTPGTESLF